MHEKKVRCQVPFSQLVESLCPLWDLEIDPTTSAIAIGPGSWRRRQKELRLQLQAPSCSSANSPLRPGSVVDTTVYALSQLSKGYFAVPLNAQRN